MSIAFDEAGHLIESADFDYSQVEQNLSADGVFLTDEGASRSYADSHYRENRALQAALEWISQKVPKSDNGVIIRANIACWHYLKAWRPMTLTALAAQIGRDKQAVGRWEDDFKLTLAKGHWRQRA